MKRLCITFLLVIALGACSLSDEKKLTLDAEMIVSSMLKDPDSARFSRIFLVYGELEDNNQKVAICGLVNGKNSFGAYTGGERFIAYGSKSKIGERKLVNVSRAYLEGQDRRATADSVKSIQRETIFEKIHWNKECVSAEHAPTYSGETW